MRVVKFKLFAVGFLLTCFMAAGAVFIWQENSPEKKSETQTGFAVYFYQDPAEVKISNTGESKQFPSQTKTANLNLVLWLIGVPLAAFSGFAIGFILRGQENWLGEKQHPADRPVTATRGNVSNPVSKSLSRAKKQDNSFTPLSQTLDCPPACQSRFRSQALAKPRENSANQKIIS